MSTPRIMAVVVLLLATPILFVKIPWLIPTINALQKAMEEMAINGAPGYFEEKSARAQRGMFALGLYFLGIIASIGLISIASGFIQNKRISLVIWFDVVLVACGLAAFEFGALGKDADKVYVALFMAGPIAIAILGVGGFACSLKCRSKPREARSSFHR